MPGGGLLKDPPVMMPVTEHIAVLEACCLLRWLNGQAWACSAMPEMSISNYESQRKTEGEIIWLKSQHRRIHKVDNQKQTI